MKANILLLLLLLIACNPIETPNNIDGVPGPASCLTLIKFKDQNQENYVIAGNPIVSHDNCSEGYIYDESHICFAGNSPYPFSDSVTYQNFIKFIEDDLKICGSSPYIELTNGYVLLDWKWHYVYQMSVLPINRLSFYQFIEQYAKHHMFITNILWNTVVNLSPIYFKEEQGIEQLEIAEIKIVSIKTIDLLRGQNIRPDKDFTDFGALWYYHYAMDPIHAFNYSNNKSPKLKSYIEFCDSMQNVYKDFLITYIKHEELSKIIL